VQSKFVIATICALLVCFSVFSQENKEKKKNKKHEVKTSEIIVEAAPVDSEDFDPLTPARAAFYSAVLPGLGQAYNRKYWKIPIIYGGLATGIYFYIDNNNLYNRYRDAYKSRLAGFKDDEFYGVVTDDGLRNAQKQLRRNKEISLLVCIGVYALNIIDANVDAHLLQYNVDDKLTLQPHFELNEFDAKSNLGLTLNFKF